MIKGNLIDEMNKENNKKWKMINQNLSEYYSIFPERNPSETIKYFYYKYVNLCSVNAFYTGYSVTYMHIMHKDCNILTYTKGIRIIFEFTESKRIFSVKRFLRNSSDSILMQFSPIDIEEQQYYEIDYYTKFPKILRYSNLLDFIYSPIQKDLYDKLPYNN